MTTAPIVAEVAPAEFAGLVPGLARILHDCVARGASIGFVAPFALTEADAFRRALAPALAAGERALIVARLNGRVVGSVQLAFAPQPNGRHRAEVAKLLVAPAARRRGVARALMACAEDVARANGRWLLILDTAGDAARALYGTIGYRTAGDIPGYALSVDGVPEATTMMWKRLDPA